MQGFQTYPQLLPLVSPRPVLAQPHLRSPRLRQYPRQLLGSLGDGLIVALRLFLARIAPPKPGARLGQGVTSFLLGLAQQSGAAQLACAEQTASGSSMP